MKKDTKHFSYLTSGIDAVYHEAALKFGLSDSALRILYTVCINGNGCLLNKVVNLSGISKQTVNSSIRKLEESCILYLKAAEGHNKRVYLTDYGKELAGYTAAKVLQIEGDIFSSWTEKERDMYIKLTNRFLTSFKEKIREN